MFKKLIPLGGRNYSTNRTSISFGNKKVGLVGAPFSDGQPRQGTELGPEAMRKNGLVDILNQNKFKVNDYGDLKFTNTATRSKIVHPKIKNLNSFLSAAKTLSDKVHQVTSENDVCLTIGGDHSMGFGTINGHSRTRKNLGVLWIDAHADINSVASTNSGNAHGMPVSFLIDKVNNQFNTELHDKLGEFDLQPSLGTGDLVFIGLRDVEPIELDYLKTMKITYFTMKEIDQLGIDKVLRLALDALSIKERDLHVSFDVDSIDPLIVPSTGTPVIGGLTCREAYYLAELISDTNKLKALDIVEINPLLGTKADVQRTLTISTNLILNFLGKQRN